MTDQATAKRPHRRLILAASVVAIAWLFISSVTGPLFGNLSTVQKNDNSKFLPSGTESSRASDAILKFSKNSTNNQFPTLILFEGKVDPTKIASANAFAQGLAHKDLIDSNGTLITGADGKPTSIAISKYLAAGAQIAAFPSAKNDAILANIPLDSASAGDILPVSYTHLTLPTILRV